MTTDSKTVKLTVQEAINDVGRIIAILPWRVIDRLSLSGEETGIDAEPRAQVA